MSDKGHISARVGDMPTLGQGSERDQYRRLAEERDMPFTGAEPLLEQLDPELATLLPRAFQSFNHVIPIARRGDTIIASTSDPNLDVPELAKALDATQVELWLVTPTDLARLRMATDLQKVGGSEFRARLERTQRDVTGVPDLAALEEDLDSELVALSTSILLDAIANRASDIHLERYGKRVRVRFRIDGDLHDADRYQLTPDDLTGLVSVVKVRAQLDITERRIPQGGRFSTRAGDQMFDLRVQTQPALHGEHVVLRLLQQTQRVPDIEELGFPAPIASDYRRLLRNPAGLILVVGPTGCGKSTTLYAGLQLLAADQSRKVISVEDPIEYGIEGMQQCEARPDLGFGFARAMRSFVRQDPDVILVGEIRDGETALEAIRASQTGHLVLSTLHCNDTVDAVQRLFDLGMHPNSVASELTAVFSQRLARRICPHCREPDAPSGDLLDEVFGGMYSDEMRFYRGRGCEQCQDRGTRGRIATVEHLPVGPEMRRAISQRLPLDDLRAAARLEGVRPMRDHALSLVKAGIIALEELPRMLSMEQLMPDPVGIEAV
ncbi:MAG: type II/IV secretion system protein [Deltaproteobacteria bacterium]|nr:type II/IV secretion system protein [Deltaproteobacteria bacterium]